MFTTTPILSEMHYNLRLQDLISAQRVTPAPPHYHLTNATQDLFQFMPQLLGKRAQEESWVAYLRQGRLCHLDPVAQGDLAYTPLTTFAIHQRALLPGGRFLPLSQSPRWPPPALTGRSGGDPALDGNRSPDAL